MYEFANLCNATYIENDSKLQMEAVTNFSDGWTTLLCKKPLINNTIHCVAFEFVKLSDQCQTDFNIYVGLCTDIIDLRIGLRNEHTVALDCASNCFVTSTSNTSIGKHFAVKTGDVIGVELDNITNTLSFAYNRTLIYSCKYKLSPPVFFATSLNDVFHVKVVKWRANKLEFTKNRNTDVVFVFV